jgi:molecular chaperone GrpE
VNSPHDEASTPEQTAASSQTAESAQTAETNTPAEQGQGVTQAMYDTLQTQAQEYLEGWQRNRAEFANYKKRIEREMKDSYGNAAGSVIKDILPAIDDFERAMNNVPEALKDDKWVGGVGMVLRKFNKILEDYNVTTVDPVGEPFDPNRHEAIGMDDSEDVAAGHVTATMQKGYVLGDRVLRPALVRVAK